MIHESNFPPGRNARRLADLVATFERDDIEAAVDMLIDMLDAQDGDPDLEPDPDCCLAGDDGCGPRFLGRGRAWGYEDELLPTLPRYGADQARGPVNYKEACRTHYLEALGRAA